MYKLCICVYVCPKKSKFLITVRKPWVFFRNQTWDRLSWYLQRYLGGDPRHLSTKSLGFGAFRQGKKVELQAGNGISVGFLVVKTLVFSTLEKTGHPCPCVETHEALRNTCN